MQRKYKTIFFNLDGTLTESGIGITKSAREMPDWTWWQSPTVMVAGKNWKQRHQ